MGLRRASAIVIDGPIGGSVSPPCASVAGNKWIIVSNFQVTRPTCDIEVHMPERMSPHCFDGIIDAVVNCENANAITSTGRIRSCPTATGILVAGNHRSH